MANGLIRASKSQINLRKVMSKASGADGKLYNVGGNCHVVRFGDYALRVSKTPSEWSMTGRDHKGQSYNVMFATMREVRNAVESMNEEYQAAKQEVANEEVRSTQDTNAAGETEQQAVGGSTSQEE